MKEATTSLPLLFSIDHSGRTSWDYFVGFHVMPSDRGYRYPPVDSPSVPALEIAAVILGQMTRTEWLVLYAMRAVASLGK